MHSLVERCRLGVGNASKWNDLLITQRIQKGRLSTAAAAGNHERKRQASLLLVAAKLLGSVSLYNILRGSCWGLRLANLLQTFFDLDQLAFASFHIPLSSPEQPCDLNSTEA